MKLSIILSTWLLLFHVSSVEAADEGGTTAIQQQQQQQEQAADEILHADTTATAVAEDPSSDDNNDDDEQVKASQPQEGTIDITAAATAAKTAKTMDPPPTSNLSNAEAPPLGTANENTAHQQHTVTATEAGETLKKDVLVDRGDSSTTIENPALGGKQQRLWGSPTAPPYDEPEHHAATHAHAPPNKENLLDHNKDEHPHHLNHHESTATTTTASTTSTTTHHNLHIPFVPQKSAHPPPPGFTISARVYIDPVDKLGYIDNEALTLPYWDCGTVGSTTWPLPVKEATFRHSLTPSQAWCGTDGKHPILAIALSEFLLETSSGDTKLIQPGQAVLLEDVMIPGHKIRPAATKNNHHHHEVRVLFLTLPNTHYRTGKDQISISTTIIKTKSSDPCPLPEAMEELSTTVHVNRESRLRKVLFGIVGLSLSTIFADFLGKTAPLWLAVGVGGTAFVVGGTIGAICLGEAAVTNFQAWRMARRLSVSKDDSPSL